MFGVFLFVSFHYLNSGFSQAVVLFCRFVLFKAQIHRECSSRLGSLGALGSQGDPGAVVFEFAGQHPTVELVKLHQLDQVREACVAIVQTEEHLPFVIHLQAGRQRGSGEPSAAGVVEHGWENSQVRSESV